ncbi:MAG TPA: zinc ribbon domain-containing protein [Longimicrobiales bacterium]|nr:zinc ribbon domain-containing protein [Longimicrobiales bacterium]
MPTYEYRCPEGHEFEAFQKMSDPPEATCPVCGKAGERRLSGGAGLLFKGSGFYITDYRSESYKKAAASESGESGAGGKGEEGGAKGESAGVKGEAAAGKGDAKGGQGDAKGGQGDAKGGQGDAKGGQGDAKGGPKSKGDGASGSGPGET